MHRFFLRLTAVLALAPTAGAVHVAEPAGPAAALSDFFKPGTVFQDRNGDGVVDFVSAQIVLGDKPTAGEIAAAADVAARLGFETTAMNIPVPRPSQGSAGSGSGSGVAQAVRSASDVGATVFIGARALSRSGLSADSLGSLGLGAGGVGAAGLKTGDGLVAAFTTGGKPAVAILGGDDSGIAAAALMFAGHLPFVGDSKGPTTDTIADDLKQFLAGKGIRGTANASALFVKAGADGVDRLIVDVQLSGADLIKAQVALNQFKATAERSARRPLSYPQVRELRIRLRGPAGASETLDLPRSAPLDPPTQGPARRPGTSAKETVDLSSFYSIDGALGD
ncbi:MAG TPA: hypothetical protein VMS04_06050, partial [Vicinamibacterales bacterium]|nr:hypothetical protein [Vicinamibacterales bacterium]